MGNLHFESKPRHVTPQIDHVGKMRTVLTVFNTHLWGFWGDRWENVHFESKPRHVRPQIDHLGKTSTVLRVSTHIYGVSKEIDGKTFIVRVTLGMWPLKSIVLEKWALSWGFQHTFFGVSKEKDGKMFIFRVNLGIWHLKSIVLEKTSTVLRVSTHIYGVFEKIHGKTSIFQVNLGMWLLKLIISEKWALFWGFQHTFMGFLRR